MNLKKVNEILFSRGTYEVEIDHFWTFLKLSDNAEILDFFCTCEKKRCIHIKTAYKYLIREKKPLHIIFENSFFNILFQIAYNRYKNIKKEDSYLFKRGKKIFLIKPLKNKKKFFDIIEDNKEKNLKISSFSFEEIQAYKENRASDKILYELSFFQDIAKELFFLKETNNYKINFFFQNNFPNSVEIVFEDIIIKLDFFDEDFEKIIPTLNTIKSNLFLLDYEEGIENIEYLKDKRLFKISKKKEFLEKIDNLKKENYKIFNGWIYFFKKGFLKKEQPIFFKKDIVEADILLNYPSLLQRFFTINYSPKKAKYNLFFDKNNNLHLSLYIFEKEEISDYLIPWIYIENKGFFLVEEDLFLKKEKIVLKKDISDFVDQYKFFLQNTKNFKTHFGAFQEEITYKFEEDLFFFSKIQNKHFKEMVDFGRWIYVDKKGFFEKKKAPTKIKGGMVVRRKNISNFISSNKEELFQIKNFFFTNNPIKRIGIIIDLNNAITITPKIEIKEEYQNKKIIFIYPFLYIEKKGFFEIPNNCRLPKDYEQKKEIAESNLDYFFNYEIDRLKPFIISIDQRLQKYKFLNLKLNSIKKEGKKYILSFEYISDIGKINIVDIYKNKDKKYFFSKAGCLDLTNERFEWIKNLDKQEIMERKKIKIGLLKWIKLSAMEDIIYPKIGRYKKELEKILKSLKTFEVKQSLDLSYLNAILREYQKKGALWLWFLYSFGLSGILCDEMGLGKTHQAMALLASSHKYKKNRYLVVCPTSVIYHWEDLLKRYLKELKISVYHGILRSLKDDFDILLTSYGLTRIDEEIAEIDFEMAIFDEIQIAKNKNSQVHQSLKKIKAKMKLGLTGTPIENRLIELKNLFDIILPSFFPEEKFFKNFFVIPIEKEHDKNKRKLLSKLIKPFILRRKKDDVLLDLPEKVESIYYADLLYEQKELYFEIALKKKAEILKELEYNQKSINYIHIFSLLSKLKQVCDHPVLINKDIKNYQNYNSGKWELFKELLNEARESNQKVVVFSQYLIMLNIMKDYLEKKQIQFGMITGATKNRYAEIKKFTEDPKCEVFLASLLAAGLGIDLSVASVVIHYDRWWNPAKENQATDRVHRIGQSKNVQVFKLITKNTIEERIHQIIENKKYLFEKTIEKEDIYEIKKLSREDIISIFKEIKR
ncbi:MAG: hypothetical protein AMS24_02225 [Chlamydiae bacterium SM23_39]|nr:MAG: hypothetical protein AMS24_02225 [Chlamydiae bacterium SM23_39]